MSNLPPPPPPSLPPVPPPPAGPPPQPAPAWPAPLPLHRVPEAINRPGWVQDIQLGGLRPTPPRRRKLPLVALAVVLLVGGLAYAYNRRSGPGWASRWDPRVEPLARFVESTAGSASPIP